jgi:hypothetical protein
MPAKLIALESTNQPLLDKTAKYLALKLQSEGHSVEVLAFPQKKQSSSHFVESHQKGEYGEVNPYAASMFYILDRYDASPQIKQLLSQGTTVICKGYRGSSLAKLGAGISDAATRRGFYIWADSLESGTFEVPRPDMAIVLSEEIPTLYELCELFPKDYVFAVDPTKVRNILNKLIPPTPAIHKKAPEHKISWIEALSLAGNGTTYDFSHTKSYVPISKKSKNSKLYASGLHELEELKKIVVSKLPVELSDVSAEYVSPVGAMGSVTKEVAKSTGYKNQILKKLITQNFESNYGVTGNKIEIIAKSHFNELAVLPELLLHKTELNYDELQTTINGMPISKKIELYKSYLAGCDNDPGEYSLSAISTSCSVQIAYSELRNLKKMLPSLQYSLQPPTPRWGFDIPQVFDSATDEIENCFLASLKLHSKLMEMGETKIAEAVVLIGSLTQAIITFDGASIRKLCLSNESLPVSSSAVERIIDIFREEYPLLTSK